MDARMKRRTSQIAEIYLLSLTKEIKEMKETKKDLFKKTKEKKKH